jgi:hypothetical protein
MLYFYGVFEIKHTHSGGVNPSLVAVWRRLIAVEEKNQGGIS